MVLAWIMVAALAGGLLSMLLAAVVLILKPEITVLLLPRMISFSTGALLGAALLGMVPHALKIVPSYSIGPVLLAGLLTFFVMEKLLVWRHCHKYDCKVHASTGPLLLIGDSFHNFVDGVVLAGAFLQSTSLGVGVAFSTIMHEVPQEVGEFVVYLRSGYTRPRALMLNALTSLTTVPGALMGYLFLSKTRQFSSYLLAFAAAGFLYVALADLIPTQREKSSLGTTFLDVFLVASGTALVGVFSHLH